MLWEFEGKRYPFRGLDLSTRDIMELQAELVDAPGTRVRTFDDLRKVEAELRRMEAGDQPAHPEFSLWTTAALWAAMRAAGVELRFSDMLDWPRSRLNSVRPILQPEDHEAGEGEGKARRPSGSGAGKRRRKSGKKRR